LKARATKQPKRAQPRDLFGKALPRRQAHLAASLHRLDSDTFDHRLERLQYLNTVFPKGMAYMLPPETHFIFQEAKAAYVAGFSVAVVLLTQAFIEHYYQLCLQRSPHCGIAERGLAGIVDCLRQHNLEHELILNRVDALRLVRNPFTHLKKFEHPHTLSQRAIANQQNPLALLEEDAKKALDVLFAIIRHSKFRG
jgi:hypothetical protein